MASAISMRSLPRPMNGWTSDGRLRICKPPGAAVATTLDKYMVVDNTGVVHWRSLRVHCDRVYDSAAPKMVTAWRPPGTNGNCPDQRWLMGIGMVSALAKLHVEHNATELAADAPNHGSVLG